MTIRKKLRTNPRAENSASNNADDWVVSRKKSQTNAENSSTKNDDKEKLKRITFEVPSSQHSSIKIRAASKGMTIREYMLSLIEQDLQV